MKPWAYVAILVLLVGAVGGIYKAGHSSGYDKRSGELEQDIIDAQESAREDEAAKWQETVRQAEAQVVVETVIEEKIRVVEKEIPTVVEKIVEVKPECSNLGDAYARLRNDQVRAANGVRSSEAADSLAEGVP